MKSFSTAGSVLKLRNFSVKPQKSFNRFMKLRFGFLTFLVIFALLGAPAQCEAWEFKIDSALLSFRYVYASQAGPQGFFGPFNVDMSSTRRQPGPVKRMVPEEDDIRNHCHDLVHPLCHFHDTET